MAESYFQPGKQCFGPSENPDTPQGWKSFCDCMFLQPVEVAELWANGSKVDFRWPDRVEDVASNRTALELAAKDLLARGFRVEVRPVIRNLRTPTWEQCVRVLCALPGGCQHPADTTLRVPFDVAPGLLAAPWTDVGAGARRIPKKDAGLGYDLVGQLFSVNPKDYTPLALWDSYFRNQAKFLIDTAKIAIFAPPLVPIVTAMMSSPVTGIALLLPLAGAQAAAEGKDAWGYIVRPALMGTAQNLVFAVRSLSTFVSARYFELAGALVAKFAEDQIATKQIEQMSPPMQGIVKFFAQYGEELGRQIQDAVTGGLKLESADRVMGFLASVFTTLSNAAGMPVEAQALFRLMSKSLRVAETMARGIQEGWSFERIADRISVEVFGFSITQVKQTILSGPQAITQLFSTAQKHGYFSSPQDALKLFDSIGKGFTEIANVITEANKMFDGALDGFKKVFVDAQVAFGAAAAPVEDAVKQAVAVESGAPVAQSVAPKTGSLTQGTAPVGGPSAQAPKLFPSKLADAPSQAPAFLGAAIGAFLGGPLGGAAGFAVGGLLASRGKWADVVIEKTVTLPPAKASAVKDAMAKQEAPSQRAWRASTNTSPTFAELPIRKAPVNQGTGVSTWQRSPELKPPSAPAAPSPEPTSAPIRASSGATGAAGFAVAGVLFAGWLALRRK